MSFSFRARYAGRRPTGFGRQNRDVLHARTSYLMAIGTTTSSLGIYDEDVDLQL